MPTEIIVIAIVAAAFGLLAAILYSDQLADARADQVAGRAARAGASQPRPRVQHCPLCGVAMLGSKSNQDHHLVQ